MRLRIPPVEVSAEAHLLSVVSAVHERHLEPKVILRAPVVRHSLRSHMQDRCTAGGRCRVQPRYVILCTWQSLGPRPVASYPDPNVCAFKNTYRTSRRLEVGSASSEAGVRQDMYGRLSRHDLGEEPLCAISC